MTLDVTMTYIGVLIRFKRNETALRLVRKTIEVRDRKLGELDKRSVEAHHLMGMLLNRVKRYKEAV